MWDREKEREKTRATRGREREREMGEGKERDVGQKKEAMQKAMLTFVLFYKLGGLKGVRDSNCRECSS